MKLGLKVSASVAALTLGACAVAPMPAPAPAIDTALQAPRVIALEGAQNFRDIGGYRTWDGRRVDWGKMYRSAELSKLTATDVATLKELNVDEVFDLRSTGERKGAPDVFAGRASTVSVDYDVNAQPISAALRSSPSPESLREASASTYPELLMQIQPELRQLFEQLLADRGPVIYHCTAGKDRTGIATALILSALGVPRETIYADYLLSNRFYHPQVSATPMRSLPPELSAVLLSVDKTYLDNLFRSIDAQYGSVDGYLDRALGVDAAKIARLRALYTE